MGLDLQGATSFLVARYELSWRTRERPARSRPAEVFGGVWINLAWPEPIIQPEGTTGFDSCRPAFDADRTSPRASRSRIFGIPNGATENTHELLRQGEVPPGYEVLTLKSMGVGNRTGVEKLARQEKADDWQRRQGAMVARETWDSRKLIYAR